MQRCIVSGVDRRICKLLSNKAELGGESKGKGDGGRKEGLAEVEEDLSIFESFLSALSVAGAEVQVCLLRVNKHRERFRSLSRTCALPHHRVVFTSSEAHRLSRHSVALKLSVRSLSRSSRTHASHSQ